MAAKRDHPQQRIGIREIRQDASMILARVESGEEFIITNRGVPVAKLSAYKRNRSEIIEEMLNTGELIPAAADLWDLPAPTFLVKGKSATELLLEEREDAL